MRTTIRHCYPQPAPIFRCADSTTFQQVILYCLKILNGVTGLSTPYPAPPLTSRSILSLSFSSPNTTTPPALSTPSPCQNPDSPRERPHSPFLNVVNNVRRGGVREHRLGLRDTDSATYQTLQLRQDNRLWRVLGRRSARGFADTADLRGQSRSPGVPIAAAAASAF